MGGLKVRCTHVLAGHQHIIMVNLPSGGLFIPLFFERRGEKDLSLLRSPTISLPRKKKKERLITSHFMVKMFGFNEKRIILASVYQVNQSPEQILLLCNQHHPQPSLFPPAF